MSRSTFHAFPSQTFALCDDYRKILTSVRLFPLPLILPKVALTLRDGDLRLWFPEEHPDAEDSKHSNARLPPMGHAQAAHFM